MLKIILLYFAISSLYLSNCQRVNKQKKNKKAKKTKKGEVDKQATPGNPMKYIYPIDLPDQNQDGYADNQDFQKAFGGYSMTRYEISQLFEVADTNRNGKVNKAEWATFYNAFIQPFEAADTEEPRDGVLDKTELEAGLAEFKILTELIKNQLDKQYLDKIMNTLCSRTKETFPKLALNLNEYIFLRRSAVAFEQCSMGELISKSQIQTCAQTIMLPTISFSENQQNIFFHTLRTYSRFNDKISDQYKFLSFLSIFHKYDMFQRIRQNKANSGVVNWRELESAAKDSQGPSQKLNLQVVNTVFSREKDNLEFTGLDFKQFFILMQSIDFCYIYGKENPGLLNFEEFDYLLDSGVYNPDIIANIDDDYEDKKEEDEAPGPIDHSSEQKLFSQTRKARFQMKKTKKVEKNEKARQIVFNIFDLTNDNENIHAGELFNFFKYSAIFTSLTSGNVHLVYQRNLDFDAQVQQNVVELPFFKEEQFMFTKLQRWMRDQQKFFEMAINLQQFCGYFFYRDHFTANGQQSKMSNKVPFPAFLKTINDLGYQLHKGDILNNISYAYDQPSKLHAQKFDVKAYNVDGATVDYEAAFHNCLVRYSKSMMMNKFFQQKRRIRKSRKQN